MRQLTTIDQLLGKLDQALAILNTKHRSLTVAALRANPAETCAEPTLTPSEIKHSISIMRVNHAGEMAAQGLYQGQALTASNQEMVEHMQSAADEEMDHLAWCQERIQELGGRSSYLDPLWFLGAVLIGMAAGIAGDRWSLGFIAETENQVSEHLQHQVMLLPEADKKSARILQQMDEDEQQHASRALAAGGTALPWFIKILMRCSARVMVKSSYYF